MWRTINRLTETFSAVIDVAMYIAALIFAVSAGIFVAAYINKIVTYFDGLL